jgi:hypothetical protein
MVVDTRCGIGNEWRIICSMKRIGLGFAVCVALFISTSARSAATVVRSRHVVNIWISAPGDEPRSSDMLDVVLKVGQRVSVRAEARWTIGMTVTSEADGDRVKLLRHREIPKSAKGHFDEYRSDFVAVAPGCSTVNVVYTFRDATWGTTRIVLCVAQ